MLPEKHRQFTLRSGSGYDGRIDPVRKIPLQSQETVIECQKKQEIISRASWETLEECPFCSTPTGYVIGELHAGQTKKQEQKSSTPPYPEGQRDFHRFQGLALVALLLIACAGIGGVIVYFSLNGSDTRLSGGLPTPEPVAEVSVTSQSSIEPSVTSQPTATASATLRPTSTSTPSPSPTKTPLATSVLPTPIAFPSYHFLSLESANVPDDAIHPINLPIGLQMLAGVPFRIRSGASSNAQSEAIITQCDYRPSGITNFSVLANTPKPKVVHLLMSGTAVQQIFSGKEVGTITLHFSSGRSESIPLIAGFNIRNWALDRFPDIDIATITSPDVQEAWRETVPLPAEDRIVTGTWDKLAIPIPEDLASDILTSIEISDSSLNTVKALNPCIYVIAITVEYEAD